MTYKSVEIEAAKEKLIRVFPMEFPEDELMWGIVECAIEDLCLVDKSAKTLQAIKRIPDARTRKGKIRKKRLEETAAEYLVMAEDARDFLANGCWPATIQGISQSYVTRVLTQLGLV